MADFTYQPTNEQRVHGLTLVFNTGNRGSDGKEELRQALVVDVGYMLTLTPDWPLQSCSQTFKCMDRWMNRVRVKVICGDQLPPGCSLPGD